MSKSTELSVYSRKKKLSLAHTLRRSKRWMKWQTISSKSSLLTASARKVYWPIVISTNNQGRTRGNPALHSVPIQESEVKSTSELRVAITNKSSSKWCKRWPQQTNSCTRTTSTLFSSRKWVSKTLRRHWTSYQRMVRFTRPTITTCSPLLSEFRQWYYER